MNSETILEGFLQSGLEAHDARLVAALARAGASVAAAVCERGARSEASVAPSSGATRNVHGELVHDLDTFANDCFIAELAKEPCCGGVLSEESERPLDFRAHQPERFVCIDPLDGSSNVDTLGPTGSIFGVLPWAGSAEATSRSPGRELVLAGYLLYSSSTLLVLATAAGVDSFLWQASAARFVACQRNLRCPRAGEIYSVNEAHAPRWPSRARHWLASLKSGKMNGRVYTQRYSGTLVADAHRALVKGGVFAYPSDSKAPRGKLRLQYEVNPMAFIFEAAGGAASTGSSSPLDLIPEGAHERCPVVLGSQEEVRSFESLPLASGERLSQPPAA